MPNSTFDYSNPFSSIIFTTPAINNYWWPWEDLESEQGFYAMPGHVAVVTDTDDDYLVSIEESDDLSIPDGCIFAVQLPFVPGAPLLQVRGGYSDFDLAIKGVVNSLVFIETDNCFVQVRLSSIPVAAPILLKPYSKYFRQSNFQFVPSDSPRMPRLLREVMEDAAEIIKQELGFKLERSQNLSGEIWAAPEDGISMRSINPYYAYSFEFYSGREGSGFGEFKPEILPGITMRASRQHVRSHVDGILTVHEADECPATGTRKPCDEFEMLFYKVYFYYDEEGTRLEHVSLERKENRKFL